MPESPQFPPSPALEGADGSPPVTATAPPAAGWRRRAGAALARTGLSRTGLARTGLARTGLARTGLARTGPEGARRSPLWVELMMIVWLCWVYDAIANLAPVRAATAHRNAGHILGFEKALHIDPEATLDHWLIGHATLASALSNYYDNAHFVVTLGLVALLWWRWPVLYRPLRNSLVLVNVMAMVIFWLAPTAPPRLYDPSVYVDVVARTHAFGSWHSGTLATAANQLAAMPSLHLSWACWSALAAWRVLPRRWWAGLVWLYPVTTAVAVMATGNHFLLDVVAGSLALGLSTLVADRWQGWWTTRQARRALEQTPSVITVGAGPGPAGPALPDGPGRHRGPRQHRDERPPPQP